MYNMINMINTEYDQYCHMLYMKFVVRINPKGFHHKKFLKFHYLFIYLFFVR